MTDLKCLRCGAALLVANQRCKFCSIEMEPVTQTLSLPTIFEPYEPRPVSEESNSSIRPFDGVGDVLGPTSRLFTDNLWFITKLVFVIVAPLEILKVVSLGSAQNDWQFESGTYLLQMLSNIIIAPALIFGLMKVMQTGEYPGVNQSYRWGLGKIAKLGLSSLLAWLIISLGLAFCVVPGIVFAVALALTYPLAVLERGSVLDVLRGSQKLTEGHRLNIFLSSLVVYAIVAVISAGINEFAALGASNYGAFWTFPLAGIITAILNQAPTVLSLVMYLSIRRTLEGEQAQ